MKQNVAERLVSKLLTPQESNAVAGGSYAKETPTYCSYSQSASDPNYDQTCEKPKDEKKEN